MSHRPRSVGSRDRLKMLYNNASPRCVQEVPSRNFGLGTDRLRGASVQILDDVVGPRTAVGSGGRPCPAGSDACPHCRCYPPVSTVADRLVDGTLGDVLRRAHLKQPGLAALGRPRWGAAGRTLVAAMPACGLSGVQSGWSKPTTCRDTPRCSPGQLNKRWALPSRSVVNAAASVSRAA